MAIKKTFRYSGTTCNLVRSEMGDRVAFSFGDIPFRRESLRSVKGKPRIGEILVSVGNVSFFSPGIASSESIQGRDFTGLSIFEGELLIDRSSRYTAGHVVVQSGKYTNVWPDEYKYISGRNPRKLIGSTYNGFIFELVADGRRWNERGLSFADYKDLIPVLEKHLNDKIMLLVNCDGGGSAGVRFNNVVYGPYDGRTIGVFLEMYSPIGNNLPTLRRGSRGQYVTYLQQLLNTRGYNIVCDGDFGNITHDTVMRFQSKNKLVADGIVGKITWGVLK